MTKLKKTIASLAACALMTSALALNVSAVKFYTFSSGAEAYATLSVTSTSATATTSINATGGSVNVSIHGKYYAKGTTSEKNASNGGGGQTGAQASITNGGGTWISVDSNHSATDGKTSSGNYSLSW